MAAGPSLVRQLVAAAGLQLLALKRVRVGGFVLPRNLPVGSFRKMELNALEKVFPQQPATQQRWNKQRLK
eukprot:gene5402-5636_t